MAIEFHKTINRAEVNATYLNLTDDSRQRYGSQFPPRGTDFEIIDSEGRRTRARKLNNNQIWSGLQHWFNQNGIKPGTRIRVKFDDVERSAGGLHVLHLEVTNVPPIVAQPTQNISQSISDVENEDVSSELPLSLERQLEDFLSSNLSMLEVGLKLFRDESGNEGRQYPTDVGVIDLLCIRPNGELLVVELKRGRSSDVVVGQISRYMGWVTKHISNGRPVKGLILTYEQDDELRYAVSIHPNIDLKRFKLRLEILPTEEI